LSHGRQTGGDAGSTAYVSGGFDSHNDSQIAGHVRTTAHDSGMCELAIELLRTLMDGYGR